MHELCEHVNHNTWKKDMNKHGHICKQTCESWKYRKKRTYRLSTYLHELTLWEGTTLVIKENESLWDLKYGLLTEKKILKHGFQNFFNFKGKRDVDTIFCPASIHASKQRPEKKIKKKRKGEKSWISKPKMEYIYIYIYNMLEWWIKKSQHLKNSFYRKSDQNPIRVWSKNWLFDPTIGSCWILGHLIEHSFSFKTIF